MTLVVVGGHFPHNFHGQEFERNRHTLYDVVARAKQAAQSYYVLLIADTNFNTRTTHHEILKSMGASGNNRPRARGTQMYETCCFPHWGTMGPDRVIANFGKSMDTVLVRSRDSVSGWAARYLHLPIIGSLTLY